jgi:dTDP-glucose pyrophosphorylase
MKHFIKQLLREEIEVMPKKAIVQKFMDFVIDHLGIDGKVNVVLTNHKNDIKTTAYYDYTKPLIKIFDKPMILYVLDNLQISNEDKIFIIYFNVEKELFENTISKKYPNVYFIELKEQTNGPAETIFKGIDYIKSISSSKKNILLDCDTFYTEDVLNLYRTIDTNATFYVNNTETKPIYSYIMLDSINKITEIKEKIKISNNNY